jgi:energy-coupling factor transport system ATP-binding protein
VTGFFYTVLRLDRLLAGILSAFLLYSVNLLILTPTLAYGDHRTVLSRLEEIDRTFSAARLSWHPCVIVFFCSVVLASKLVMDWYFNSEAGLALRALEDESAGIFALERQGISASWLKVFALAAGNAIIGIAGALASFKEGAANADRGFDLVITGLVAFLIGTQVGDLFSGLSSRILRRKIVIAPTTQAILGAIAYFVLITGSQRAMVPPAYTKILLVVLVALSASDVSSLMRMKSRPLRSTTIPLGSSDVLATVRGLSYRYPSADADCLSGVSFDVLDGEIVRLVGRNGSGKTTTLRILAGFISQKGGSIFLRGEDVSEQRYKRVANIAYIDQNAQRGVVGLLSTRENLILPRFGPHPSFWRRALSSRNQEQLTDLTSVGQLPKETLDKPADFLSGGQRQVVNLLTLLAHAQTPDLVLLDEPLNNLDEANNSRCLSIIAALRAGGATILCVSHTSLQGVKIDRQIDLEGAQLGSGRVDKASDRGLGSGMEPNPRP